MAKYIVTTARSKKSFSTYMGAVNYALRKSGEIVTDNGVSVPTIKVGGTVMYKNYVCRCVNLHQDSVDLHGEALQMGVNFMGIDPTECREVGGVDSQAFYCEQMQNKLEAEKPSRDFCRKVIAALRVQRVDSAVSPIELEGNSRIDGFISAIEQYMGR